MTETTAPEQGTDTSNAQSTGLSGLKLAQLQALAAQLGITGARRMRKSLLVEAIEAHQRGGAVAERDKAVEAKIEQTARKASQRHSSDAPQSSSADDAPAAASAEAASSDSSSKPPGGLGGRERRTERPAAERFAPFPARHGQRHR